MKKYCIFFITIIILFSLGIQKVDAGVCSAKKAPLTHCTDEPYSESNPNFSDPSLNTIKNNNCNNYSETINKYCKEICREEAVTNFPKTINPMSVDRYQPILGGSHFQWEKTSIITKKECQVEIDYSRWEKDYEIANEKKKYAAAKQLQEWYALSKDRECGEAGFVPRGFADGKENGAMGWSGDACICNTSVPKAKYTDNFEECNGKNVKCKEFNYKGTVTQTGDPNIPGALGCANKPDSDGKCQVISCGTDEKTGFRSTRYSYDSKTGKATCYYWRAEPNINGKILKWKSTHLLNVSPKGVILDNKYVNYCETLPYYDVGSENLELDPINNKWTKAYKENEENVKNLESQLRACNNRTKVNKTNTPLVEVNYTDPTKNYTSASGLKIKLELKDKKPIVETGDKKVTPSNEVVRGEPLIGLDCNLPAFDTFKNRTDFNQNIFNSYCKSVNVTSLNNLRNTKIYQNVKTTYNYNMPSNIFRYTLKETGEAVNSNSSKVTQAIKDNYRYVDIGYPNYPVHYTTPTGEYPIYLTYSNLGTKGYWTNKLPNKTGRYDCTYKVVNRIIPCKDGECPPCVGPDCDYGCPGGPNNPNCPGSGQGINVIYRPIALTEPFPDYSAKGRKPGENWTADDVKNYITNNRGANANEVYNKAPLYTFTLDAKALRAIRDYNKSKDPETKKVREYNDFNLTCSSEKNGKRCMSKFLKGIKSMIGSGNASGTCLGARSGNFYACADKLNQDTIKCGLNKDNKMECTNCYIKTNKNKAACKNITEGSGK